MIDECLTLPDDYPDYLRRRNDEAPVPTWEQVTRSTAAPNLEMIAHLSRIVANTEDEEEARLCWEGLPNSFQRSVALLVDKIYHEGWLDRVGPIKDWPWDGGFFFYPRDHDCEAFAELLDAKSASPDDPYIQCRFGRGLFAYLNIKNHRGWVKGWMETDTGLAALHIGLFKDGLAEVHFDLFNSLYIVGAPAEDLLDIPLIGAYNRAMFRLHKKYELSRSYASLVRTSANFYHLMRDTVPLSF